MDSKNYYKTLQVDPDADPEVIEGAYRRLGRKYHPDVNHAPDATQRMQAINEAYEVLRDPVRRREYDRLQPRTQVNREAETERKHRETEEHATRERQETEGRQQAGRDELVMPLAPGVTMVFARVPASEFLMGSDPGRDRYMQANERPQHWVYLPEFYIGKYQVTNSQYVAYAKAVGLSWSMPIGKGDHPAVNVSWHDAVTFCKWAGQLIRRSIQLPTEAQWEKAARGLDGRIYPWGGGWDSERLNCWESGPHISSQVGYYSPQGDSPYGAADMAGNTWEWTSSLRYPYPYRSDDGRENPYGSGERVLRGGAYHWHATVARCAYRNAWAPGNRNIHIGFRVCLSPIC